MIRVHTIPFSTNAERVALAAAHKGVEIEWVEHHPSDRSEVRRISGQELVPVLEDGADVVFDSTEILRWLDDRHPEPPLWPADPARRAEADVFVEWFNGVWKGPPNAIADGRGGTPEAARLLAWVDLFESLLEGRDFLLGDTFGIADVVAFPFLKYPVLGLRPGDSDRFHEVLVETMPTRDRPNLRGWVERIEQYPRA